jgi:integrase
LFTLFRQSRTDARSGQLTHSKRWHVRLRDHLGRRQSFVAFTREQTSHAFGEKLDRLVECRRAGMPLDPDLSRWLESIDDQLRARLVKIELLDATSWQADVPLLEQLEGKFDQQGQLVEPGYKQILEAKGDSPLHVAPAVGRPKRVLTECGISTWRDLVKPSTATKIQIYLGELRARKEMGGTTLKYYVRELQAFCRWLYKSGRAPSVALQALTGVENAEVDAIVRRAMSFDEMMVLLPYVETATTTKSGITGAERALAYRFAFETGMRPGQMRALTPSNFQLDARPPTVTTHARHVKRRRQHVQILRPGLAAALRQHFSSKMPNAHAFKMPKSDHLTEMFRRDLASARDAWIRAGKTAQEQVERGKSDFLAAKNHAGEVSVFYSIRHGHGTTLAERGVAQDDIASSMHHASSKTTQRYTHAALKRTTRAIDGMPDLEHSPAAIATGTDGAATGSNQSQSSASADQNPAGDQQERSSVDDRPAERNRSAEA